MSDAPTLDAPPGENPWYLRPFFGRTPVLPAEPRRVLGLVALGIFFENYDIGLVNAALPQIANDLAMPAEDTGFYLAAIRLGGIGTFLLLPLADRLGRRRLFMVSFLGMSLFTLATTLVQSPLQFAAVQLFARVFLLMASALALVIVAEEFPAENRGSGLALLSTLGGLGFGLCSILYAGVDYLPFGWRTLYFIGVIPLVLIPFFRRSLKETRRFQIDIAATAEVGSQSWLHSWFDPLRDLARTNPRRALLVGVIAFFSSAGAIAVFQYTSYFAQEVHDWTPGQYAAMVLLTGVIPIGGMVLGGRGSDRFGRRPVGFSCLCVAPLFAGLFYLGPSAALPLAWAFFVFCSAAGDVILRALAVELVPTSQRGTSAGWMMLLQTLGWAAGLFFVGFFSTSIDDLGITITYISFGIVIAAFALLAVPETHGLDLETISDEVAAPGPPTP